MGNDMYNNLDDFDEFASVSISEMKDIEFAESLYTSEDAETKKHEALRDIALKNVVDVVRSTVRYDWCKYTIDGAIKWLKISKSKYDKRKKYDEQMQFEALERSLSRAFDADVHIENIELFYPDYMYRIIFTVNNIDYLFTVNIPNLSRLSASNIKDAQGGKLAFGYIVEKYSYKYISMSFNLSDFKDVMRTIVTSDEHKQHLSKADYIFE